jgi:antitoxin HicB
MKKDLNGYLSLPYKIEIVPIAEDEGGGYLARLPQFGVLGIVGDGETKEEALADLAESQKERFQKYLEEGLEIPEPETDPDEYSGRFLVRFPKYLHRELSKAAKENGVSLNQYICTLLSNMRLEK